MAYNLSYDYGYGEGTQDLIAGDQTIVNNYARVSYATGSTVKIESVTSTGYGTFEVGQEVLLHLAAYKGTNATYNKRGRWRVCTIKSYNSSDGIYTLSKNVGSIYSGVDFGDVMLQLVTIPHFKTVTINSGKSITCPPFNENTGSGSSGTGGIVVFKCSEGLYLNGGHINLKNKGLPDNSLWEHGWIKNEPEDNILRISHGWENYRTLNHLPINYPDGACWIATPYLSCVSTSRIGNPDKYGVARTNMINNDSLNRGVNSYSRGGSSIFIAAKEIANFNPKIISKIPDVTYGQGGRGHNRCYIATETTLPTDELLYACDKISDPERLSRVLNITGWGDESAGEGVNKKNQLNSYMQVLKMDKTRTILSMGKTSAGWAKIRVRAMVMIHSHSKGEKFGYEGKFLLTTITAINSDAGTVQIADPYPTDYGTLTTYNIQLITIPQFQNLTITNEHTSTLKYDEAYGIGGIFAVACKGTCDLSGGYINVTGKGTSGADGKGGVAYGEAGLNYIGNASMCERLPIGQGHGSIFILAQNLIMNQDTRLGSVQLREEKNVAESGGNYFGGICRLMRDPDFYSHNVNAKDVTYQYSCDDGVIKTEKDLSYQTVYNYTVQPLGGISTYNQEWAEHQGTNGGANGAGKNISSGHAGGFGSNSTDGACQGAHLMIIADKIKGFNLNAICTGGDGGKINSHGSTNNGMALTAEQGGAGYGGSGGSTGVGGYNSTFETYQGGNGGFIGGGGGCNNGQDWTSGGGSGAFCFVYCNSYEDYNSSGISYD